MSEYEKTAGRRLFLNLCAGVFVMTLGPRDSQAEELRHLTPADPTAAALGYSEDSATVDATKFPQHKASQTCASCQQFTKLEGSAFGSCLIFAGKWVTERGWCGAYAQKS